jgi:hypothetical protein
VINNRQKSKAQGWQSLGRHTPGLPSLGVAVFVVLVSCISSRADIFELTDGGQIEGQLVERGPKDEYVIAPKLGGTITISKKQVADIVRQSEHQAEYDKRSRALPDTVAAHRSMADWCREHQLSEHTDHHLKRIIELDPNDEAARTSLGYQKHQGKWLTRDEIMAERGMYYYDGAYRTAQDIALRKRESQTTSAEVDWLRQLKLWRGWLDSRNELRVEDAQTNLMATIDPLAATAVVRMINAEEDEDLRHMWMEILSQIQHPASMRKLVDLSIVEPDRDTRLQCVEYLMAMNDQIDIGPYIKALKAKDNTIVNIAAEALGLIGNPEAISPLIDALVTTHKFKIEQVGEMSASFSRDGSGGGLSAGNKPQFFNRDLENPEVRGALVKLSGDQDHGYEQMAWRRWFVNQQKETKYVDPRRDQ